MGFTDGFFQLYGLITSLFWLAIIVFFVYVVTKFLKLTKERNEQLNEIRKELKKQNESKNRW